MYIESSDKMLIIEKIIISVILIIIGLILISLGIYFKMTSNKFKKDGIKTNFKVKNVLEEDKVNAEGQTIGKLYTTTFEFEYNGKQQEETITTRNKFKTNTSVMGIYLPTGKLNKISVAGEGFQISTKANILLLVIGLLFLAIPIIIFA